MRRVVVLDGKLADRGDSVRDERRTRGGNTYRGEGIAIETASMIESATWKREMEEEGSHASEATYRRMLDFPHSASPTKTNRILGRSMSMKLGVPGKGWASELEFLCGTGLSRVSLGSCGV